MPTLRRFEDIESWKKARELARSVYEASSGGPWSKDFALRDQIRRAAISVLSNIAEGFERGGDKEFRYFLAVAKGSVGEVKAQLYVALDAEFVDQKRFDELYGLATETGRLLGGFIRYLSRSGLSGPNHRELRESRLDYTIHNDSDSGLGTRSSELTP